MFLRRKFFIAIVAFGLLGVFGLGAGRQASCEEAALDVSWDGVRRILDKKQIVSEKDADLINVFLDKKLPGFDKRALTHISQKFKKKIGKDVFQLKKAVGRLEPFSKNAYTRSVGKINQNDLVRLQKLVENLEEHRRVVNNRYYASQDITKQEFIDGIRTNAELLIGKKDFSVGRIWKKLKNLTTPSYQLWNERFQLLKEKAKKYDRPAYGAKNYFSYDEVRFYGDFKAIQTVLRRISAGASSDF